MISMARSSQVVHTTSKTARILTVLALLLACTLPLVAQAKKSDRDQPVEVSAKSADAMAKPNGVSHLVGDVVITQGTLKATGAKATIHFDADSKVSRVVLTGAPAHLRQIDDNGNLVKAHAGSIDYDVAKGIATLLDNAWVKQAGRGTARGDSLVYNTENSTMTAHSKGDNRVHLTFQPRQGKASGQTSPAPATSSSSGEH